MEIFKLFGSIFIDTDKADKSLHKTEEKTESFASKLGKGIKTAGKWGGAFIGAASTVGGAVAGMMTSVAESTREYRGEMGKLETAFQNQNHSAETAKSTYKDLQVLLGDTGQAVEAASHLAMLCDSEKQLSDWTTICTGVYAQFGASLPIEGLTEAANEAAKTGALTGSLADALNWAGVNEDEFNASLEKCSSEQERQQLITETLTELYGKSAEAYRENNAEVMEANASQEKMNETMAKFGEVAEPVITKGKTLFAQLLEALLPVAVVMVEKVLPPFVNLVTTILDVVVPCLQVLGSIVGEVLESIFQSVDNIIGEGIIGLFEGLITFLKGIFTGDFKAIFDGLIQFLDAFFVILNEITLAPINFIIDVVNGFIKGINNIKVPDWVPGIGGKGINIETIQKIDVPGLWQGGNITGSGTVMVGEKGPELLDLPAGARVRPLDNSGGNADMDDERMLRLIVKAIIMALKSVKMQEIIEIVPDEKGLFKIIRKKAKEYEEMTGNPAF